MNERVGFKSPSFVTCFFYQQFSLLRLFKMSLVVGDMRVHGEVTCVIIF